MSAVEGAEVVFRLADAEHALESLRLWQELGIPGDQLDFKPVEYGWELRLARPSAHRMEYMFELPSGEMITDPTNPRVVGGAFGEHSWLPMPGYAEPTWLAVEAIPGSVQPLTVEDTPVGPVEVQMWTPDGIAPGFELPLLVSHDGSEFASYAGLTQYVGAMIADGTLPAFRLALVRPGQRNLWYAANPDYATALTEHVLGALTVTYNSRSPVLMGASLGALAALYAEWHHPGTFAGLFLQSGSFFSLETDPQESGFEYFAEVTGFVGTVLDVAEPPSRPLVGMTSGTPEENVHNNRVMAARLTELGLDVTFVETPDMHNFTAWRDTFDPALTSLLQRCWT